MNFADLARYLKPPAQAATGRAPVESDSFPRQWEYVTSAARSNVVMCSRRSGKTVGARYRTILRAISRPGARILYVTLIRKNTRKLFWHPLKNDLRTLGWEFRSNEVDLNLVLPNGSYVEATSVDDIRDVGKVRGDNWGLVIVDECQEPRDEIMEQLIEHVIAPSLIDQGGDLDLLGTPPDADVGYFAEQLKRPGARVFNWSMHDNPHISPDEIRKLCEERGIGPGHPVYEREIMGRLVHDPGKLAYEFDRARNEYDPKALDVTDRTVWRFTMGLDLGFQDSDAIVVIGWRKDDPERRAYVVHEWAENHFDLDQLSPVVGDIVRTFRPTAIVADHGGHGAVKVIETLKSRLGVMMQVKPADVMVSVGLVNDDLRTGRLLVPTGARLADDLLRVTRSIDTRAGNKVSINKSGFHSDLTEALRYAHHAAANWAARAPKPEPTLEEQRRARRAEIQRQRLRPYG